MKQYYPVVLQAVPGEEYTAYAYMNDGTVRLVDVKPLIEKGGVFLPLRDMSLFQSALTVMNETIAWDLSGKRNPSDCIDIDPFSIMEMPIVKDEIEATG